MTLPRALAAPARPSPRRLIGSTVLALLTVGLAIPVDATAAVAPPMLFEARATYLSVAAGGATTQAPQAAAAAPGGESARLLTTSELASRIPLDASVDVLGPQGLLTLTEANQYASVTGTGASAASGAVDDDGVPTSAHPSDAVLSLDRVIDAATAPDINALRARIGSLSAAASRSGLDASGSSDIASLTLSLTSPALASVYADVRTRLASGQPTVNALPAKIRALPSVGPLATVTGVPNLSLLAPPLTTVASADGSIAADLSTGVVTIDVARVLRSAGLDLHQLPPTTELVSYVSDAMTSQLRPAVLSSLAQVATNLAGAVNSINVSVLGVPVSRPVLAPVLDPAITQLRSSIDDAGLPVPTVTTALADALERLVALTGNVQHRTDESLVVTALRVDVLPSLPASRSLTRTSAAAPGSSATIDLASASVTGTQAPDPALTTRTWTGLGSDGLWTNDANWDAVPVAGNNLVFPDVSRSARRSAVNDFPAGTPFGSIRIEAGGYTLTGNALSRTGGLFASGGSSVVGLDQELAGAGGAEVEVASGAQLTLSGALSGGQSGTETLTKSGPGLVALSAAGTYAGRSTVAAGTLVIAHGSALGAVGTDDGTVVAPGATLELRGGISTGEVISLAGQGVGGTAGALLNSAGDNIVGDVTLTGDATVTTAAGSSLVIASALTESGRRTTLTTSGSGLLDVRAAATVTGGMVVTGGTVTGAGGLAGPVVVSGGATFEGRGGRVGAVTVDAGSLVPGSPSLPQTSRAGSLTLGAAATYAVALNGASPGNGADGYSRYDVTGPVTLGGAALAASIGYVSTPGDVLTIVSSESGVTGQFAELPEGSVLDLGSGRLFRVSYAARGGRDVTLSRVASTITTLTSAANPATAGDPVALTATVAVPGAGTVPTGTVTFSDGATALGTAALTAAGTATLTVSDLPVGSRSLTATYSGDSVGLSSTSPVLVQVVDQRSVAPTANDDSYDATEDTRLVVAAPGVLANDSFGDTSPADRRALLVSGPVHGRVVLAADGGFVYTPDADYHGVDAFTYRSGEGASSSGIATVRISVRPVDDAPRAVADTYTTAEGRLLEVAAPGVLANDVDPDGDATAPGTGLDGSTLVARLAAPPADGSLDLRADGGFTYRPDPGFVGRDEFVYQVTDPIGLTDTARVVLQVTAAPSTNQAPTISGPRAQRVVRAGRTTRLPVRLGDPDDAASSLRLSVRSSDRRVMPVGRISLTGTGESRAIRLRPARRSTGSALVSLTVRDPSGATATTSFRVIVTAPRTRCTITRTSGDDVLRGTDGRDVICGGAGDDTLIGRGGADVLRGGPGDDRLVGGPGRDMLFGGPGDDTRDGAAIGGRLDLGPLGLGPALRLG